MLGSVWNERASDSRMTEKCVRVDAAVVLLCLAVVTCDGIVLPRCLMASGRMKSRLGGAGLGSVGLGCDVRLDPAVVNEKSVVVLHGKLLNKRRRVLSLSFSK